MISYILFGLNIEEFQLSSNNNQQSINRMCADMICYICLRHNDPNVVSSLLETLEIILKYSNWIHRTKTR
ncbi:unnamed protein product [Rotaria sp. Silwood2]|nr:unnamed protein product [Rotaria sp. Silwood2]